jgi:hypothetical protein
LKAAIKLIACRFRETGPVRDAAQRRTDARNLTIGQILPDGRGFAGPRLLQRNMALD